MAALLLWIAFIWGNSLMPGAASTSQSDRAASMLGPLFGLVGVSAFSTMTFVVRKSAHFLEYAVLAILGRATRRSWGGEGDVLPWALVFLVPVLDECIQLFVPGRSGMLRDVLIDLAGMCFGLLATFLVGRIRSRMAR